MRDSRVPELEPVASPPQRDLDYYDLQLSKEPLGEGGQTVVYEASVPDSEPPETVAVRKLGDREFNESVEWGKDGDYEPFFEQARKWASLSQRERIDPEWVGSDHIVGVVAVGEHLPWAGLEYMDGGSLAHRLEGTDGLPVEEAVWIGERLCQGLQVAHDTGVAHLDLKPGNILFRKTETGTWDVPKIADWGLARNLLDDMSDSMEVLSPLYAAPEQFDQEEFGRPGTATDIYQLGAVLYALLTGDPPYTGSERSVMFDIVSDELAPPPSQRRNELSEKLDAVVRTALTPRKSDRYDSIAQFKQALRAVRDGRQLPAFIDTKQTFLPAPIGTETRSHQEGIVCRKRIETQTTDGFRGVVVGLQLGSLRSDSVECVLTETLPSDVSVSDVSATEVSSGTWITTKNKTGIRFKTTLSPDETLTIAYRIPATLIDRSASLTGEPQLFVRPTTPQTQWRMFGGSPDRKGGPAGHTGPDAPVTTRWRFDTFGKVSSSPAVADGTVYVGSRYSLYAVDAATGDQQWRFNTDGNVDSSPAVADGTVYVGCGSRFDDGKSLYAVDAATGTGQWRFDTSGSVESSPAVVDGTVYVGNHCRDLGNNSSLYAVDTVTGNQEWQFDTSGSVESSPAVVDGTVYVGSTDRNLYAVDAATGEEQWRFDTDESVMSSPAVADGTVYIGGGMALDDNNGLYAVDATTGEQQWDFNTSGAVESSPVVVDGTVYVGSWDHNLYAVDAATGTKQWEFNTDAWVESSPAVVDGTVYVGSYDRNLYAVDAATGTKQWQFDTGGIVESSPAVVDGTVYVGSHDHNLYAVDAATGNQEW
jgi:outer membrane protein assembly factor BamB/serine/threonine protein kinase